HVAHVEVVRQYPRLVLQGETQIQQLVRGGVHTAQQHTLITHVTHADLEGGVRCLGHQRCDGLRMVRVGVDRQIHTSTVCRAGDTFHPLDHFGLQPVLWQSGQGLTGKPDVADVVDVQQPHQEPFELVPRYVGDIATGDHHVTHLGVAFEVVDHRVLSVGRFQIEFEFVDL